jgi:hypothetical protein
VTETVKLLKRLGYPDTQDVHKSSSLLSKINGAIMKRMTKLEETKRVLEQPSTAHSQLSQKILSWINFGSFGVLKNCQHLLSKARKIENRFVVSILFHLGHIPQGSCRRSRPFTTS